MEFLFVSLLIALVVALPFLCVRSKPIQYKHPQDSIGIGPVWNEGPPLHYMYVWKDNDRLKMEFRNLPGVVVACDARVAQELSETLKKFAEIQTAPNLGSSLEMRTVSKPGAVLEVKAVPIPPDIQDKMAKEIRDSK
jgi:hypothetical protein